MIMVNYCKNYNTRLVNRLEGSKVERYKNPVVVSSRLYECDCVYAADTVEPHNYCTYRAATGDRIIQTAG